MKKFLLGTAAAAVAIGSAAPASAQYYDRDRRGGIDTSDVVTGIAVVGGIAAILSAFDRDGGRYGYDNRYRYRDDYSAAVNSCGHQAQRTGGGQVRITDVDRRSNGRYEVEGVVERGYGGYGRGYDRGFGGGFGGRDYGERFTCVAYGNGRITQFRMRDGYASRSRW
ncbi:MAG: hypothetical protein QOI38_1417 [Sphingomonadales bacterium]|jgi:hypothetical protein|nr:hypothetical protein [Sphingomonadales bacterium]